MRQSNDVQLWAEQRAAGLTLQQIADEAGVGVGTVHRALSKVEKLPVAQIVGRDGKSRPATYKPRSSTSEPRYFPTFMGESAGKDLIDAPLLDVDALRVEELIPDADLSSVQALIDPLLREARLLEVEKLIVPVDPAMQQYLAEQTDRRRTALTLQCGELVRYRVNLMVYEIVAIHHPADGDTLRRSFDLASLDGEWGIKHVSSVQLERLPA